MKWSRQVLVSTRFERLHPISVRFGNHHDPKVLQFGIDPDRFDDGETCRGCSGEIEHHTVYETPMLGEFIDRPLRTMGTKGHYARALHEPAQQLTSVFVVIDNEDANSTT